MKISKNETLLVYPRYGWHRISPPLGLAYLASSLEINNIYPAILDMNTSKYAYDCLYDYLKNYPLKIVGVSFMTSQFNEAFKIITMIKKSAPEIKVIVGGPHASSSPYELINHPFIDFVIIGEGESTIVELADHILYRDQDYEKIDGIVFKNGENIITTEPREYIKNIDNIPFPAWHLLEMNKYSLPLPFSNTTRRTFSIMGSRGCCYHCIFCNSSSIFGRKYRTRSPENIYNEMKMLNTKYGVQQIEFIDDTMTINKKRLLELCHLLTAYKLNIKWICNARIDSVDLEMLLAMKNAGCAAISYGVESNDDKHLMTLKKGITSKQIIEAHKLAKRAGLIVESFFLTGIPGEDLEDVQRKIDFVNKIDTDFPSVQILTPFPGTELYDIANKNSWIVEKDWGKYVTTPHFLKKFRPVMITDKMSQNDILESYYFINSNFFKRKYITKYGKYFVLNPLFYRDNIFKFHNIREVFIKLSSFLKMMKSRLLWIAKYL
jgi:anaerobic magnesium-protoporphyrin IX monomethyl ester cyclase